MTTDAETIAGDVLHQHEGDLDRAVDAFRGRAEVDPGRILAALGEGEWRRVVRTYLELVRIGRAGAPPPRAHGPPAGRAPREAERRAHLEAARREAESVLSAAAARRPPPDSP